jgi:hypothetical protein
MKIPRAPPVRRVIREVLSICFWFHALYLFRIIPSVGKLRISTTIYPYDAALLLFILYYSYFSDRSWLSVLYDLFYVYVWPFVIFGRACLLLPKRGYRFAKEQIHFRKLGLITKPSQNATVLPQELQTHSPVMLATLAGVADNSSLSWQKILRPINQFAILCSLFAFTIHNRWFLYAAILIAAYGAAKAVWVLWFLVADVTVPLEKAKALFAKVLSLKMTQVLAWKEKTSPEQVTNEVNALSFYETCLAFIEENRGFWSRCTLAFSVLLTIPFYLYVSFLMSCVYYGIAKIEGINWSWTSAVIDSLYIPVAFGDLPHIQAIKFVAGLHCIVLGIIGWNVIFRQIGKKFEDVVVIASELRNHLRDETLQSQISRIRAVAAIPINVNKNRVSVPDKGFRKPPSRSRKITRDSAKYPA